MFYIENVLMMFLHILSEVLLKEDNVSPHLTHYSYSRQDLRILLPSPDHCYFSSHWKPAVPRELC